ncbi:hypothetical protein ODDIEODDIE_36 [Escherichia phage vB_EcoS_OddieOddie]|nr:hypothetical protein ODDIEODDIE_36 [Escherichia phage vB_EcoS_OddieOddie]
MSRQLILEAAFYKLKAGTADACSAIQNDAPTNILKQQLIDAKHRADEAFNEVWRTLELIDQFGGPFQK